MKLHVHHQTMVLCIQYKFDEIPSIGYLAMAEDGNWTDGLTRSNLYPSLFWWGKKIGQI